MAKFGFDSSEVDVNERAPGNYEPIPEGEYTLEALEAEDKVTKDGGGSYINAKFEVKGGEHDGRLLWHIFNVQNRSETAQRIGRQQLVSWATACGKPEADDTDKLIGKKFRAIVEIQKGTGGYKDSNRVKVFLFDSEAAQTTGKSTPAKSTTPAKTAVPAKSAGAKAANPWD